MKSITTFHYPVADTMTTYTDQPSFVHDFEQSLLVWAVVAGLQAGQGREIADRAGPKIFGPCTSLISIGVRHAAVATRS